MTDTTVIEPVAPDSQTSDDAPAQTDAETRAYEQGWRPEAEYKGAKPWIDAETFLKNGEERAPLAAARADKLEKALERAHSRIDTLEGTLKRSIATLSKAEQRAYERAKSELEGKLDDAAEIGDAAAVRKVTGEIVALEKDAIADAKPSGKTPGDDTAATPEFEEAFETWKADNAWFEVNEAMTDHAVKVYGRQPKTMAEEDKLAAVTKAIKAEFPHKFENPRRREAAAVEGASGAARKTTGKAYSDLPADARNMCDEFVKQKLITREKYVAEFFANQ